jgi:hypothetical protein
MDESVEIPVNGDVVGCTSIHRFCRVVIEDGHQFILMPSGERIPHQVWTRVYDDVDTERAYAIIKVRIDLTV